MIKPRIVFIGILLISILSACEKAFMDSGESNDPVENFDALFKTLESHYVYFDYKNVDPKVLYNTYRPKVSENTTNDQLFEIMTAMLDQLKDGHLTIDAPQKSYFYNITAKHPANFYFGVIEKNYLTPAGATTYQQNGAFAYRILDSNIGYVHYKSFKSSMAFIDQLLAEFKNSQVEGLILDVRNNTGGEIINAVKLAARFTDQKRFVGTSIFKTGPGRNDYSDSLKTYVAPEGQLWKKPVMVLTNRGCYSACSYFVEIVKHFPGVTIVGAATAGGGGMPLEYELPNGWAYRVTATAFFGKDGFNIENGVPPEYPAATNADNVKLGKDNIIDRAIALIKASN